MEPCCPCAATLPALYEAAFRNVTRAEYEACEQECWIAVSRLITDAVRDLGLPVRNAAECANSFRTVFTILFGPDVKAETIEVSGDGAVILIKRCPFLLHGCHTSPVPEGFFSRCIALTLTAIPLLNKNYSARFVRTICTGDRQCEIKIAVQTPDSDKTAKKESDKRKPKEQKQGDKTAGAHLR